MTYTHRERQNDSIVYVVYKTSPHKHKLCSKLIRVCDLMEKFEINDEIDEIKKINKFKKVGKF